MMERSRRVRFLRDRDSRRSYKKLTDFVLWGLHSNARLSSVVAGFSRNLHIPSRRENPVRVRVARMMGRSSWLRSLRVRG
jgi:hypothetical protein